MHYVGIYPHISSFRAMSVYTQTRTHILKPFEDSKPTGLKVDIAELDGAQAGHGVDDGEDNDNGVCDDVDADEQDEGAAEAARGEGP